MMGLTIVCERDCTSPRVQDGLAVRVLVSRERYNNNCNNSKEVSTHLKYW